MESLYSLSTMTTNNLSTSSWISHFSPYKFDYRFLFCCLLLSSSYYKLSKNGIQYTSNSVIQ